MHAIIYTHGARSKIFDRFFNLDTGLQFLCINSRLVFFFNSGLIGAFISLKEIADPLKISSLCLSLKIGN